MTSVDVELGLTALAAMLSPTTLTFSILTLVLGNRPRRTGLFFFLGAFGVTMIIGASAFISARTRRLGLSETPPTWVAILDLVFGAALIVLVVRALRRPRDPARVAGAVEKMSGIASSPAVAVVAADTTLANPGGFIPVALKDISQLNPSAGEYIVLWTAFAVISLLPLLAAIVALTVAPEWATARLHSVRGWLERNAIVLGGAIVILLAAALLRNGIVALTS